MLILVVINIILQVWALDYDDDDHYNKTQLCKRLTEKAVFCNYYYHYHHNCGRRFQNQVIVGLLFLIISGMDINDLKTKTTADILNNVILFVVFVITLVNAVVSGFGIKHTDTSVLEALHR